MKRPYRIHHPRQTRQPPAKILDDGEEEEEETDWRDKSRVHGIHKMKRKQFTKQMGYLSSDLLHASRDHLISAKVLFKTSHQCFDSAGYLSHIAIELLLKALLLYKIGKFPDSHFLIFLHQQAKQVGIDLHINRQSMIILRKLDEFEKLRYPVPTNPVEIGDEDWAKIHLLYTHMLNELPEDIYKEYEKIDYTSKGGRVLMRKPKKKHKAEKD